jgi:hypothetical protein
MTESSLLSDVVECRTRKDCKVKEEDIRQSLAYAIQKLDVNCQYWNSSEEKWTTGPCEVFQMINHNSLHTNNLIRFKRQPQRKSDLKATFLGVLVLDCSLGPTQSILELSLTTLERNCWKIFMSLLP